MKINYKDYIIEFNNTKNISKKELSCMINDSIKAIDKIIKKDSSVKDSTSEYYKGYMINPCTKLHDETCDCKYEITKDGVIIAGVDSIEAAKEKIDNLIEKNTVYTKDASVIIDFSDFKPWPGAVATYDKIVAADKLDDFEAMIDELYPDGIGETELNDWLWFDGDDLLEELGIIDEDKDEDEDEDED